MNKIEVVHLSTSDIHGGAARAAYRLHRGLNDENIDSSMFVRRKSSSDEAVHSLQLSNGLIARIRRRWRRERIQRSFAKHADDRPSGLELFSDDRTPIASEVVEQCPEADILNLHWIANFVDLSTFFDWVDVPVVWTLHDMNSFTGGCHYNAGCRKFETQCGACPQLASGDETDLSRTVWSRKQNAYQQAIDTKRLHIVSPSEWLAREAKESALLSEVPIHVIPYGLDHETFRPRSTEGVRTAVEIPKEHRIVLFVAQSTQNHRKGFDLLADTLSSLVTEDVTLLSIGGEEPGLDTAFTNVHLGTVESDLLLSVFYSLADLFVVPSRQDNLPNTVLESMACGTPVVGFDTGGIPDMVRPGETGWLAEVGNVRELRQAIERALSDDVERERFGKRCRAVVEEEYTLKQQSRRYRVLYEKIFRDTDNG